MYREELEKDNPKKQIIILNQNDITNPISIDLIQEQFKWSKKVSKILDIQVHRY